MKIALVNTLYPPHQVGGAERSVQLLAEGLLAKGHEPVVLTLQEPLRYPTVDDVNGVRVYRISLPNIYWPFDVRIRKRPLPLRLIWHIVDRRNPFAGRWVSRILERERPDVVHTHNLTGFSAEVWNVAARLGLQVIHTTRDYSLICPRGMYKGGVNCTTVCSTCTVWATARRRASSSLAAAVGVSRFVLERHERAGFFARVPLKTVIHNPIARDFGVGPQLTPSTSSNGEVRIGYIGRLDPTKGIEDLLRAFRVVAEQGVQLQLKIAGRGYASYEATLKAMMAGVSGVEWLGFVDPAKFYREVDVVVVPSRWEEPFGRTVVEAFAYGIPVIAARRGGIPEIVHDGIDGWLYDPDDPWGLQELIRSLPERRSLLSRMGERARITSESFTLARCVSQHEELYERIRFR